MPRYYYTCDACNEERSLILPAGQQNNPQKCKVCEGGLRRSPRGGTSRVVETRDNGVMSRTVEQPADVERLQFERSRTTEDDLRKP
jgi:hypothetical protein